MQHEAKRSAAALIRGPSACKHRNGSRVCSAPLHFVLRCAAPGTRVASQTDPALATTDNPYAFLCHRPCSSGCQ
jgi:hypothetical protein